MSWRGAGGDLDPPAAVGPGDVYLVAPPPIRDVPEELADLFDRATRLGRGALNQDFFDAVAVLADGWTAADIEAELRRAGNLEGLIEGVTGQEVFREFKNEIRDSYEGPREPDGRRLNRHRAPLVNVYTSASDAVSAASPVRESWWNAQRWTQAAIDWTNRVGAQRVTAVADETKAGIRALIREAFESGKSRDWIVRSMVAMDADGSMRLGLDARRSRIFMKFVDELDADIPQARQQRLIDRRYRQLLRDRAATIAQTEVVTIGNEAQVDTYQAAVGDGELDPRIYIMEWITRAIGCPRCIAMDGSTREIMSGRFVSDGTGPKGVETALMPELHPRGWCFTRIIRRSEAKRQPLPGNLWHDDGGG